MPGGPKDPLDSSPLVDSSDWLRSPFDKVRRDSVANNRFLFARRIFQVSRRWRKFLSLELRERSANQSGWQALFWMSLSGGAANQRELARRVDAQESTIARALDALEQQGLVVRKTAKDDRRVKSVELTEAADPVIREINEKAGMLRDRILSHIDAADLAITVRVLGQIVERMNELEQDAERRN